MPPPDLVVQRVRFVIVAERFEISDLLAATVYISYWGKFVLVLRLDRRTEPRLLASVILVVRLEVQRLARFIASMLSSPEQDYRLEVPK